MSLLLLPVTDYTINIDKLELMLTQSTCHVDLTDIKRTNALQTYQLANVTLERLDNCNKPIYLLSYAVLVDNQRLGTLFLDCTRPQSSDLINFQLSNYACYSNWLPLFQSFITAFDCSINNITYLEIALDTNKNVVSDFLYYFLNSNFSLVSGLKPIESVEKYATLYNTGSENITLYLGKTSKRVSLYNKTLEIEKQGKQYISDFHAANGLDTTKHVYRLELRLKNNALKRSDTVYKHCLTGEVITKHAYEKMYNNSEQNYKHYKKSTRKKLIDIDIEDLTDSNKLNELLQLLLPTVLEFRVNNNTKNISRLPKVKFIDFKNVSVIKYITTVDKSKNNDSSMNKNAIKQGLKSYAKTKENHLKQSAMLLAKQSNQVDYFDLLMKQMHLEDYESKQIAGIDFFV